MDSSKLLMPSFTTDKLLKRLHMFRDKNSLGVSERHFVPEDSSTSHADTTKTKRENLEQEEDPSKGFVCTYTDILKKIITQKWFF